MWLRSSVVRKALGMPQSRVWCAELLPFQRCAIREQVGFKGVALRCSPCDVESTVHPRSPLRFSLPVSPSGNFFACAWLAMPATRRRGLLTDFDSGLCRRQRAENLQQ